MTNSRRLSHPQKGYGMNIGRLLRLGGALALLVAGLIHLDLYFGGYRSAGSEPHFGRAILFNAIASGLVAVAVAARREWFVRLAGIVLASSSLAALTYTHTQHSFVGFQGDGLNPSPQAQLVTIAEIAAIVLLAATFIPSIAERDESSGVPFVGSATVVVGVALTGFGAYWANHYETKTVAGAPTSLTIADFAFAPEALTVAKGTTVTWTNSDPFDHSVVADDKSFSSENLADGATFQFTFDRPGQFTYICGIHPSMSGTVTVTG
jgi:plastocyanin